MLLITRLVLYFRMQLTSAASDHGNFPWSLHVHGKSSKIVSWVRRSAVGETIHRPCVRWSWFSKQIFKQRLNLLYSLTLSTVSWDLRQLKSQDERLFSAEISTWTFKSRRSILVHILDDIHQFIRLRHNLRFGTFRRKLNLSCSWQRNRSERCAQMALGNCRIGKLSSDFSLNNPSILHRRHASIGQSLTFYAREASQARRFQRKLELYHSQITVDQPYSAEDNWSYTTNSTWSYRWPAQPFPCAIVSHAIWLRKTMVIRGRLRFQFWRGAIYLAWCCISFAQGVQRTIFHGLWLVIEDLASSFICSVKHIILVLKRCLVNPTLLPKPSPRTVTEAPMMTSILDEDKIQVVANMTEQGELTRAQLEEDAYHLNNNQTPYVLASTTDLALIGDRTCTLGHNRQCLTISLRRIGEVS